jgi:sulfotransferase family protein
VAGSLCSLIRSLSGTFSDADHARYIVRHWVEVLEEAVTRVMAFRASHPTLTFVDLGYDELVRDPMAAIARVYRELDETLPDDISARMRAYVEGNPQDKHGRHAYTVVDHGLDPAALRVRFAAYQAAFDVAVEA